MPGIFVGSDKSYTHPEGASTDTDKKKKPTCWCCYVLLFLLCAFLALYFLEKIATGLYGLIDTNFGSEDFNIIVSENRQIQLCVDDFGCEDGDKIRVSVNSNVVFDGEIYTQPICMDKIAVNPGKNSVDIYAINGTSGKGNCPNNINTGRIVITGNNQESQSWHQYAEENETANMNITINKQPQN